MGAVSAGDGLDNEFGEQPQLATYEDLFAAVEFFLLAAKLLPPEQLLWDVCPYLLLKVRAHLAAAASAHSTEALFT